MASWWGVTTTKVRYSKLDEIHLLEMAEGEDGVGFTSGSAASSTAFVPLDSDMGDPISDDISGKDVVDGFGDFEAVGVDNTALALAKCEKYVLRPYKNILKALGWMPVVDPPNRMQRLLQVGFVIVWCVVLVTTMITQILSCFRRDSFLPGFVNNITTDNGSTSMRVIECHEHVISAFILTDILLMASYFFGVYLFSREEAEYLSKLADQVFIKSNKAGQSSAGNWLFASILIYLFSGILWVVLSFVVRIMTTFSVELWMPDTVISWPNNVTFSGSGKIVLIILDLIGFIAFDIVYVAAVMNYAAQSEMNIYLLRAIKKIIEDKKYGPSQLDSSIKDIIECRKYIRVLNGKTATATALILFNLGSAGLVALISLNDISSQQEQRTGLPVELATVANAFNVILWIGLVSFPFIQAARVTDACQLVKASGPEIRARPQLYSSAPQLELDSFVTLTEAVKLRATMFGIPIYPWMWWAVFTGVSFAALILFQTGAYSFTIYL